ncbi:MAG: DEAD/DEAH box helicase, partial [Candidatus Diapherotrites archaeon]|nr:DEAD/DEAH box helicase [Candidatus Diapherotrites archaeon]
MDAVEVVFKANGFSEFNPVQAAVLEREWGQKNLVVAAPTGSGKTVAAELTALQAVMHRKKKAVYTCPLRALASEHFTDFKKKFEAHGIRCTISTGDFDSSSEYLSRYDIIFTTYEKLFSLLNHRAEWLSRVGVLVVDEIHEMDSSRGPTIEMVVTKLRELNAGMQVVGLSATIPNAKEIARWLNAELVESTHRPVPLEEGIYREQKIDFGSRQQSVEGNMEPVPLLVKDTLGQEKQSLVFCNTRKSAQAMAARVEKLTNERLHETEKKELEKAAQTVLSALESPTQQCHLLAAAIRQGAAFHHAGLLAPQRTLVENLFRENKIKVITAT